MRQNIYYIFSLLALLFSAEACKPLGNTQFALVAYDRTSDQIHVDIGQSRFKVNPNDKAIKDRLSLPMKSCDPMSPCNWYGLVVATVDSTGESMSNWCSFYTDRQGTIEVKRSNGTTGQLQLTCY